VNPRTLAATLRELGTPDVVVVGAGQAGLTAAVSAAQQGARVLVLEKLSHAGGSTAMSSGLTAYAGTDEQAALGIDDSVESLRADILATGLHKNDESLVDVYCTHQLATYRWLTGMGVEYGHVHAAAGQSVPRSHATDPSRMIDTLLTKADELGVGVVYAVRAFQLMLTDAVVTGVLCEVNGTLTEVAAGSVVLATGGFSRNPELLERFVPQMAHAIHGGAAGSEGDGLLMGWKAGADFRDTPYVKGTFGIYPGDDPREGGTGILAVYKGAIAVSQAGRRFVDESAPYKAIGDACLALPEHVAWQVFDQTTMDKDDPEVHIYWFSGRLATGLLATAATLEELADIMGVPIETFLQTVQDYNAAVRGERPDEFGRTSLSGSSERPTEIATGPFYAHLSGASVLATYCGLTIDPETRVLDVYGEEIPGLFAAGEVTGGFHGAGYVTGTSVGKAGVFGRLAGLAAATYAGASP
jgi:fumarate reductase flavoprotein subunit